MFNIITPTYNRAYCLDRVYNSLINQTFQNFHWIIVDDCSTDNTQELINEWISEGKITIEYHALPENQGKSIAVNFGLDLCTAPYTIIADSDDSFDFNTLEDLHLIWKTIDLSHSPEKIASIWTLTKNEDDQIVGDKFPKNFWQVNFKERELNIKIHGEKWACWRTEILAGFKMYLEPKLHIGESKTWTRINKEYDFLCINIAHRKYYNSSDGIIATSPNNSRIKRSKIKYYNAYYGLNDINIIDILKFSHYRSFCYDYTTSLPFFYDKNKTIGLKKTILAVLISITMIPKMIIKRVL